MKFELESMEGFPRSSWVFGRLPGKLFFFTSFSGIGKPCRSPSAPWTINHRLSVLASFFAYRIQADTAQGNGPWVNRFNNLRVSYNRPNSRARATASVRLWTWSLPKIFRL